MRNCADLGLRAVRVALPVFAVALLAACAGNAGRYPPAPALASTQNYSYIIGPGDNINIIVWRNPELSMAVPVRPDGKFSTPLIDEMTAQGKNSVEVARDIEKQLGKYVRDPIVTVIVTGFVGPYDSLILLSILALSGTVRAKLRVFLNRNFFPYRYDYREEWLKFTRTLSAQDTPQEMGRQVIRGLADLLESPGGGLWMKTPGTIVLRQTARLNMGPQLEAEAADSPLCAYMLPEGKVVNLQEYQSFPQRYGLLQFPAWLQATPQAWLIVPLLVGDELIGFVLLLKARTRVDVNWEVYDLLKTASRQAASVLAQMLATEALLEVRKFDSFNRMSAFVVHDLKNIVTQLSLMMKNAQRLHANPEFQQDMLMTVENSLERMRQLMAQLREGTTPTGMAFGVDLLAVLRRLESVATARGRVLEIRAVEPLVVRGHEERLERIIGHMVQNSLDATDPSGTVWLSVDKSGGHARIEVGDNGHGMTQEFIRDRLFKPFQTTKPTGMGIGAYESFQYVQEIGGKISVESEPAKGTKVTLLLPLFQAQTGSDLDLLTAQG